MSQIQVGDAAPNVVSTQGGEQLRLGDVRHIFNSQFAADRHVTAALEVVRGLSR